MFNFNNKCNFIIEDYLLQKNPIYKARGPISILLAILVVAFSKKLNFTSNKYINQIVLPIGVFILSMLMFDMLGKITINKDEKVDLKIKCKKWINDPNTLENPNNLLGNAAIIMNLDEISKYNGKINGYHIINGGKEQVKERFEIVDKQMPLQNKGTNIEIPDLNKEMNIDNKNAVSGNYITEMNSYADVETEKNIAKSSLKPELCLSGNGCGYLCSGSGINKCNVVAPVPGPQWKPQTAAAVQDRLNNGKYVPSTCN